MQILSVRPWLPGSEPCESALSRAADLLTSGELVAVPTETVYGLAARADRQEAVARIYAAKGRPAHNPLIVHVASITAARALAADWPDAAERLAAALWPGPLTLVVRRRGDELRAVSAGRDTLAVRVPSHPVLLALLERTGLPLAAPSANRSGSTSPTRAEHVVRSLGDALELVLDGGPCRIGIESSVVDVTCRPPQLLRPGGVSIERLRELIPELDVQTPEPEAAGGHLSPGLDRRHYAPEARVEIAERAELSAQLQRCERPAGLLTLEPTELTASWQRALGSDPVGYAASLFAALHEADAAGCASLMIEAPPKTEPWAAVWDRLERAATQPDSKGDGPER